MKQKFSDSHKPVLFENSKLLCPCKNIWISGFNDFFRWKTGKLKSPLNVHFNVWKLIINNLLLSSFFSPSFSSTRFGFRARTWQANLFRYGWNNRSPQGWSERSCSSPFWVWCISKDDNWRCSGNCCGYR